MNKMMWGVAAATLVSFVAALPTAADAATRVLSATFTPIGEGPNVEWLSNPSTHFRGSVQEVDTLGVPNMLINFDIDPELDGLGDLEATMNLTGTYRSYLSRTELTLRFDFFYAGDDTFTVGGIEYGHGTRLLSFNLPGRYYDFGLGYFRGYTVGSEIADFGSRRSFGEISSDVAVMRLPDPDFHGRPYIVPGQAQWSGSVTANYVPEPGTWALLIMGFGAVGAMLRRHAKPATDGSSLPTMS